MKLISFFIAVLVHLIFLIVYLSFIYTNKPSKENKKVYIVNIIQQPKTAKKNLVKKDKKQIKKRENIVAKKQKPKKKPKPKLKKKQITKKKKDSKLKFEKKKKILELKRKLAKEKLEQEKKRKNKEELKKQKQVREKILKRKIEQLRKEAEQRKTQKKEIAENKQQNDGKVDKIAYEYQTLINNIIHNNWGVEKSIIKNKHFATTMYIKLDFRGNLINMQIMKSSGSVYFDGKVIDAIRDSEPFPMPPKEILENGIVEFIITFDSEEKE